MSSTPNPRESHYAAFALRLALPRWMRRCCCRSYHRRTGLHAPGCPRAAKETAPVSEGRHAPGGEIVSAFPLRRDLLGVEGEVVDDEVGPLPAALDDVAALTVPLVADGVELREGVALAGRNDLAVMQAGLAADHVRGAHLEPPTTGTLT